ncbi:MAG: hypothetical protein VKL39_01710 [Leptolyngbyaceae bacterium]|nr:hypothetical protein [Leptolyngbyaceae bacterium]
MPSPPDARLLKKIVSSLAFSVRQSSQSVSLLSSSVFSVRQSSQSISLLSPSAFSVHRYS